MTELDSSTIGNATKAPDCLDDSAMTAASCSNRNSVVKTREPPNLLSPHPTVKIHVKDKRGERKTFAVHKNYISYYSPFFDEAFNGVFVEGQTQEMELHEVGITEFGIFVNWLYSEKITLGKSLLLPRRIWVLMKLWMFADRVLVPKLQNQVLRQLEVDKKAHGRIPHKVDFDLVYNRTAENSPLRRYILRTWSNDRLRHPENFPAEMLAELVTSQGRFIRRGLLGKSKLQDVSNEEMLNFMVPTPDEAFEEEEASYSADAEGSSRPVKRKRGDDAPRD